MLAHARQLLGRRSMREHLHAGRRSCGRSDGARRSWGTACRARRRSAPPASRCGCRGCRRCNVCPPPNARTSRCGRPPPPSPPVRKRPPRDRVFALVGGDHEGGEPRSWAAVLGDVADDGAGSPHGRAARRRSCDAAPGWRTAARPARSSPDGVVDAELEKASIDTQRALRPDDAAVVDVEGLARMRRPLARLDWKGPGNPRRDRSRSRGAGRRRFGRQVDRRHLRRRRGEADSAVAGSGTACGSINSATPAWTDETGRSSRRRRRQAIGGRGESLATARPYQKPPGLRSIPHEPNQYQDRAPVFVPMV